MPQEIRLPRDVPLSFLLLAGVAGCAVRGGVPPSQDRAGDPCRIPSAVSGAGVDSLTLAVAGPIALDHAPVPGNDAEAVVFGQLFETLIREDCQGRLEPGLADRWLGSAGGAEWSFQLRPGLRFTDGERIDARAVQEAWERTHGPDGLPGAGIASIEIAGPLLLRVRLTTAAAVPRLFSSPAFAVAGAGSSGGLPAGSGPFEADGPGQAGGLILRPRQAGLPVVLLRQILPDGDPRDVLDAAAGGVSPPVMLISREQGTVSYAQRIGSHRVIPLPWSRVYALLAAPATPPLEVPPLVLREDLARNAVPADARAAPQGLPADTTCPASGPAGGAGVPVIAYRKGDRTAAALAERILALAGEGARGGWPARTGAEGASWTRVLPLEGQAFDSAVSEGRVAAAIIDLELGGEGCSGRPAGWQVVPLIETRAHAILPRGVPAIRIDGHGTLHLQPPGAP